MFSALRAHDTIADAPCETPSPVLPQLCIHEPGDPRRGAVEDFIRHVYAQRYGAEVRQFAPTLVSLCDDGVLVAAAGYRSAGSGPLFLERYFNAPIESLLTLPPDSAPPRDRIVEIGHLSAARAGEGRRLIRMLALHLQSLPYEWVVSTMTTGLRQMFLRLGITPLALGVADPQALGAEAAQWGSYYDHHPIVLAGQLHHALGQMARRQAPARAH